MRRGRSPLAGSIGATSGEKPRIVPLSSNASLQSTSAEPVTEALDAGRLGIWRWEIKTGKVTWSPALERIHHLPPGSFGGTFSDFQRDIHPEDQLRVLSEIERAIRERNDFHVEYRILRPQGRILWLEARGRVLPTNGGDPEQMTGVCADVTDRKRAEERLRESEARLRAILNTAVDGIITIGETGIIETANPAVQRMFGYREDELIGRKLEMLMPPPYNREHEAYLARYLKTGNRKIIGIGRDVEGLRKDGTIFPLYLAVSETRLDGKRIFTGILRDITRRTQNEAKLARQARKLQEIARELARSNSELDRFASAVAHDLRSPLSAVSLCTQYLGRKLQATLPPDCQEMLASIQNSVARMDELITDLLTYSRVGSGRIRHEPCDLNALLGRVLETLRTSVETSGATITHDPLPTVPGDETLLGQVLQNLLENAIKYRSQEPPRIHVRSQDMPGEWIISVRDNGIGIEPRHFEQIFEIFQRVHENESRYAGSGVGLATAKKIVERHGGRIWLESEPGKGSTFFFTIPSRTTPAPA